MLDIDGYVLECKDDLNFGSAFDILYKIKENLKQPSNLEAFSDKSMIKVFTMNYKNLQNFGLIKLKSNLMINKWYKLE